jgi:hypothetical protein
MKNIISKIAISSLLIASAPAFSKNECVEKYAYQSIIDEIMKDPTLTVEQKLKKIKKLGLHPCEKWIKVAFTPSAERDAKGQQSFNFGANVEVEF